MAITAATATGITLDAIKATASPALFAASVSQGRWQMARHLAILDRAIIDAIAGRGPARILVNMPPRHGKTELLCRYLPAWYLGTFPDRAVIIASHTVSLAHKSGSGARQIFNEFGPSLFGVELSDASAAKGDWSIKGRDGGLFACGVGTAVVGRGARLIIVDDPHAGAKEAESQIERENVWQWYTEDLYTRKNPGGAVIVVIQTRWHEDDLTGRLLEAQAGGADQWRHIRFPAIAEEGDILGRHPGEALWPAMWSVDSLANDRRNMTSRSFSAQYQQRPLPMEGGLFKRAWFRHPEQSHDGIPTEVVSVTRYWDKAYSADGGDYTAGALLVELADHRRPSGKWVVADVVRGRWSGRDREKVMRLTAVEDRRRFGENATVKIWASQDGGAGKESSDETVRNLQGFSIRINIERGDKQLRADPLACQAENGNVRMVKDSPGMHDYLGDLKQQDGWNHAFLEELTSFPFGKNDDQVDAVSGAFAMAPKGSGAAPEVAHRDWKPKDAVPYQRTEAPRKSIFRR